MSRVGISGNFLLLFVAIFLLIPKESSAKKQELNPFNWLRKLGQEPKKAYAENSGWPAVKRKYVTAMRFGKKSFGIISSRNDMMW